MSANPLDSRHRTTALDSVTRWALVGVVVLVAGVLRFTGLNWDLAQWIHPDEGHMRTVTGAIRWPEDASDYFDTRTSSLNPRNNNQVYSYGTLPLFTTRALAEWLERGCAKEPAAMSRPGGVNTWLARLILARLGLPTDRSCPNGTFTWTYTAFLGRNLAALADLGTVLLIYLLGRRLYGQVTGILAAALASVTALMIQQAHFYTVDSAATFFTALTAYFCVRSLAHTGRSIGGRSPWLDFALAGLSTGLAAACKVSAGVAAGLVALSAVAWVSAHTGRSDGSPDSEPRPLLSALLSISLPVLLAGILAFFAFRATQPYAFEGPGFFGMRPSPEWFGRLKQIGEEQSGLLDYPSGRQWTNRLPIVFPWINMVIWGMGLPLGLAAWCGWAFAGVELIRGRHVHLVPWAWTTLYFVFYATRWVKAMRYFLPIYPLLILFGAYALTRLASRARAKVGPAIEDERGDDGTMSAAEAPEPTRVAHPRARRAATWLLLVVVGGSAAWGAGFFTIYLREHPRVAASRWIYENVPGGSVVANEHWDWGLPLRVDGRDGFRGNTGLAAYTGITMEHYNEDTPDKRAQMIDRLDQADYIFTASNRLYGSIPRLPDRYPLTMAYYRALFAGELGFELVGAFTSYPTIGPFTFPDQETPFPLMAASWAPQGSLVHVPMPAAEESFSVYDHPNCLIFRKTADYSHERVDAILSAVDLTQVAIGQSPHEVTPRVVVVAHNAACYLGMVLVTAVLLTSLGRAWRGR